MEELDTKNMRELIWGKLLYSLAYTGKDKKKCPKKVSQ